MNESKELLEATIKGLKEKVSQLNTEVTNKEKELEDINKPEMSGELFDQLHGLVEDGVGAFDFSDADNYEFEPEFDYDNKVVIGSIELNNHYEIVSLIMNKIDQEFKVIVKE
jgi:hypothetical protein